MVKVAGLMTADVVGDIRIDEVKKRSNKYDL